MKRFLASCLLLLLPALATAAPLPSSSPSHTQLSKLVAVFVQHQTASLSGKVSFQIEEIDPRISLSACGHMEAFLPTGSQLIGKTSIGVRCTDQNGWSILVPVQIKITQDLLVSSRQLTVGHVLLEQDIARQSIEMTRPSGFTNPEQVLGKVMRYSISAGQILRDDMLRAAFSVSQGQIVQITSHGAGFSVRNEGVALNNASEGQNVQVRVGSGRVIGGTARNGAVEVNP